MQVATHASSGLVLVVVDHYLTDAWSFERASSAYEQHLAKMDQLVDDQTVTRVMVDVQAASWGVQTSAEPAWRADCRASHHDRSQLELPHRSYQAHPVRGVGLGDSVPPGSGTSD